MYSLIFFSSLVTWYFSRVQHGFCNDWTLSSNNLKNTFSVPFSIFYSSSSSSSFCHIKTLLFQINWSKHDCRCLSVFPFFYATWSFNFKRRLFHHVDRTHTSSHYFIDSFLYNIENKTVVHQFFSQLLLLLFFSIFFYFLQTCKPSKILCQFMSHFSCILFTTTSTSVYWSHCKKKEKKYMIKNRLMWFLLDFINFVDKNGKNVIQSTRIYNRISCNM